MPGAQTVVYFTAFRELSMSHDFPNSKNESATPRGGGFMLLILMAVGAFFVFSNFSAQSEGQAEPTAEPGIQRGSAEPLEGIYADSGSDDVGKSNVGQAMPGTGRNRSDSDWSSGPGTRETTPIRGNNTVQGANGWSLEDVETAPKKSEGIDLRFSNESSQVPKVRDSEWSLEPVPKKKSATNGDWKAESIGPRD